MTLVTAHKILIGSAIAMFAFYAIIELRGFTASGETGAVLRAIVAAGASIAFAVYLRGIRHRPTPPREPGIRRD